MTTGFTFTASCPRCGGELLAEPGVTHEPDRTWVDARCDHCLDVLRITVSITVVEPWPVDRCDPDSRLRRGREGAAAGGVLLEPTW